MTLAEKVRALIQEFRAACYGEDVRRTYADIAELVLIEAMKQIDYAAEQGDYAKEQGNHAKTQGDYAKRQTQEIVDEFAGIKDVIRGTENGELLLRVEELLDDMYKMATETDIDHIIGNTYVDEDEEGGLFEAGTDEDIDNIIGGTYVETAEPGGEPENIGTQEEIKDIVDGTFQN